jgi:hypothetical protein
MNTTLCIEYEPHQIAAACVYLGTKMLKMSSELKHRFPNKPWWEAFSVTQQLLEGTLYLFMPIIFPIT